MTIQSAESIIMSSDDNSLVLTNRRVKFEVKSRSNSAYKSIPIDQVATCAMDTRTFPVLLILAAVAVLVIFAAQEVGQRVGAGIAALLLLGAYFGTRNGQLAIYATSGESIAVPTKGLSHDQVKKFLEAVDAQYVAVKYSSSISGQQKAA
jgi:hypothetical protein